ncbi:MAG: hypothetical protein EBU31_00480 [Proteobacteria bacterium]|nr:hypothetical protein [Pseudomonadota bacterium]
MITPLPKPPLVTDSQTDFQNKASTFLDALPTFAIEANADIAGITNTAATPMWVATTTYSRGNVVWSPITYVNYRLKVTSLTGAAGNQDPSIDTTNWAQATGTGNVSAGTSQNFVNLTATGNLSVGGNVSLGDAGTDTTTVASQLLANASVGTSGQVLTSRGANLSPQWTTPDAPTVLLGTLTTTTGNTQTLSGLNLALYRFLRLVVSRVSHNSGSSQSLRLNSVSGPTFTEKASASNFAYGFVDIDITQQGTFGASVHWQTTEGVTGGSSGSYGGESGITTASTSITVAISGGVFDNGAIYIYGVR